MVENCKVMYYNFCIAKVHLFFGHLVFFFSFKEGNNEEEIY